jgi:hypothetical protein
MTKQSSHLAKAIKNIYRHVDSLGSHNPISQLEIDILETIIDHLNLLMRKDVQHELVPIDGKKNKSYHDIKELRS